MANIDDLSSLIAKEMTEYSEEVNQKMQDVIDEVTDEAYNDLRGNSIIPQRTGDYAKKFYKKKVAQGKGYKRTRIGNKKYQITHLLEYGHVTRNGGRTKAFPHWQQAQGIVDRLPEKLKGAIQK